jgi:malonate decarboxylase delta subunit
MTESFSTEYLATLSIKQRAHVGVVSSGDLEVLMEPQQGAATVKVTTLVSGHRKTWEAVLQRFFDRHPYAVSLEINDHGATPGMVWLRMEQALELALKEAEAQ